MRSLTVSVCAAVIPCGYASAAFVTGFDTVALSGASGTAAGYGPNVAGSDFNGFVNASINAGGKVSFVGSLTGSVPEPVAHNGVFTNVGGTLHIAARSGSPGPGPNLGAGVYFGTAAALLDSNPIQSDSGDVAFTGRLAGTGVTTSNDTGLFVVPPAGSPVMPVAREGGTPGPNLGSGVNYNFLIGTNKTISGAGTVAYFSNLTGTGVNSTNNQAVFTYTAGTLTTVARSGSTGPGPNLGAGVNFASVGVPVINDGGRVAFTGTLTGTGVDSSNQNGLFTSSAGATTTIARSGAAGPGPNLGAGVTFAGAFGTVINNAGQIAFNAGLAGTGVDATNSAGLFVASSGGAITPLARTGSAGAQNNLPPNVRFASLGSPVLNNPGKVAFSATLTGQDVVPENQDVLVTNVGSAEPAIIARTGVLSPGPDLGAGVYFADLDDPVMNASNVVAFTSFLTGPNARTNDEGLFVYLDGAVRTVLRQGDLFDVDPGVGVDLRTINGIGFSATGNGSGSGGEDGRATGFNDAGELVFTLGFTDGSKGVFTSVLPEPAVVFGVVAGGAAALWVPRRRRVRWAA